MSLLESTQLEPGWEAPEWTLTDPDGAEHSLGEYVDKDGLLIVFTCNHCPYAKAAWPLLQDLYAAYGDRVSFVAINPNDPEEYEDDAPEVMREKIEEWGLEFPYLIDQTQEVAKTYRAQCTPDPYLFAIEDGRATLFYHGRINDNWQEPEQVSEENLKDAIEDLLSGNQPSTQQPPSMGCSIKWRP